MSDMMGLPEETLDTTGDPGQITDDTEQAVMEAVSFLAETIGIDPAEMAERVFGGTEAPEESVMEDDAMALDSQDGEPAEAKPPKKESSKKEDSKDDEDKPKNALAKRISEYRS